MHAEILIVDDNPVNLRLASDVLQDAGFRVKCVTCASGVLSALDARMPNLLLVDIGLPGTDGLTLTRVLRQDPRYIDLRIVALTAFAMKGDRQKALDAGCDGYISKPINTREFAAQIKGYLDASPGQLEDRCE
jgi:CheY-like chemotaxis protein